MNSLREEEREHLLFGSEKDVLARMPLPAYSSAPAAVWTRRNYILGSLLLGPPILLLLFLGIQSEHPFFHPSHHFPSLAAASSPGADPFDGFDFRANADSPALPPAIARSLHLTYEQCDAAFPAFWPKLLERKTLEHAAGGVRRDQLEIGDTAGGRLAIIDDDIYITKLNIDNTRAEAIVAGLHEAVAAAVEPVPDVEFAFNTKDDGWPNVIMQPMVPTWGAVGWLIPDFGFYSWPEAVGASFRTVQRQMDRIEAEIPWADKAARLFWRGPFFSPVREALRKVAQGKPWADVDTINWGEGRVGRFEMRDHCRGKYLVHAEGFGGAYSGRLKYLLNCRSIVVTHTLHWDQHFHPALNSDPTSPNQNIVVIPGTEWEGLPEMMEYLEANQDRAELIAANAHRTFRGRYLTPAAQACYWRRLLFEYSSVQRFKPEIGNATDSATFMLRWGTHAPE